MQPTRSLASSMRKGAVWGGVACLVGGVLAAIGMGAGIGFAVGFAIPAGALGAAIGAAVGALVHVIRRKR